MVTNFIFFFDCKDTTNIFNCSTFVRKTLPIMPILHKSNIVLPYLVCKKFQDNGKRL